MPTCACCVLLSWPPSCFSVQWGNYAGEKRPIAATMLHCLACGWFPRICMAPLTRCRSRFTMARKVSWMLFLIAVFGVGVSLSALDAPSPLNEFVRTDMAWAPPASYTLSTCAFFMIHLDRRSRWHLPRRRPYCRHTTEDPTDSLDSYAVLVFISAVAVCLSLVISDWTCSLSPVATADTEEFPSDACRPPSSLSRMDTLSAKCVIETELLRGGIESNPGPIYPGEFTE